MAENDSLFIFCISCPIGLYSACYLRFGFKFIVIEEMSYIRGLGVQMKTTLLNGKNLYEFYKVEDIEELVLEDVLLGTSAYNALVLKMKDKSVVLFEVFEVVICL